MWRRTYLFLKNIGTSPDYSMIDNLSISWVNIMAIVFSVTSIPYFIGTSLYFVIINIIALFFNLIPLYFNYKNQHLRAKLFLIIPPIILVSSASFLFFKFDSFSFFVLAMQLASFFYLPFVIFTRSEEKYIYISIAIGLLALVAYPLFGNHVNPPFLEPTNSIVTVFWAIFIAFIVVVVFGIGFYRQLVYQYSDSLMESQSKLLAQKEEIEAQKELGNIKNLELEELNKKLSGTLEHSKDFLQMVSHDLKSPINAIIGLTDIIQSEKDLLKVRQYNEYVLHSAQKALHLIENLRQITILENENFEINKKEIQLDKLVEEVVDQNKINADKKGQIIHFDIETDVKAQLDPIKTYQVVDNILNNAVKYSPKKSEISIQLRREENVGIIEVKDNGQGFTEDEKSKLFQKFSRLSSRPTGNEVSTGLGLFICKRLVELQKGNIVAESEGKNKGSTFTIFLPLGLYAKTSK